MGPKAIDMFHGFGIDVATGATGAVEEVLGAYPPVALPSRLRVLVL